VQHAAHIGAVGVHRRVHGDHRALDRRQVTFQQDPVEAYPHYCGRGMVPQGRTRRKVHLLGSGHPEAHVAVAIRGDRPAGHHPLGHIDHLVDQVLVHQPPIPAVDDDRAQG